MLVGVSCILPALYITRTLPCFSLVYCKTSRAFSLHSLSVSPHLFILSILPESFLTQNDMSFFWLKIPQMIICEIIPAVSHVTYRVMAGLVGLSMFTWPYLPHSHSPPTVTLQITCSPLRVARGSKQQHHLPSCSHSTPRLFLSHPTTKLSENPVSVTLTI